MKAFWGLSTLLPVASQPTRHRVLLFQVDGTHDASVLAFFPPILFKQQKKNSSPISQPYSTPPPFSASGFLYYIFLIFEGISWTGWWLYSQCCYHQGLASFLALQYGGIFTVFGWVLFLFHASASPICSSDAEGEIKMAPGGAEAYLHVQLSLSLWPHISLRCCGELCYQ